VSKRLLIVTDCDGILTTPFFTYDSGGKAQKHFWVNDSITMRYLRDYHRDIIVGISIITGDGGPGFGVVKKRIADLNLDPFVELFNVPNDEKIDWIEEYKAANPDVDVVYFGDDLPDIEIFNSGLLVGGGTTDAAPTIIQESVINLRDRPANYAVVPHTCAFTNLVSFILEHIYKRSLVSRRKLP
jgi:3-deoxy-D-manno-octulosonate 8-phosphate phosphatase KdsC-like HAD superfamily phosphatase